MVVIAIKASLRITQCGEFTVSCIGKDVRCLHKMADFSLYTTNWSQKAQTHLTHILGDTSLYRFK
jgi:hypothetical protein